MIPHPANTRFVRMPTPVFHLFPAFFAGIVLTAPSALGLMRLVYGRRFHGVMAIGDAHYKFDVRTWMYATFVWIVPLCVDAETLLLSRFVIFTDDDVHARGPLERRPVFRPYSDAIALRGVDGVKVLHREKRPKRRFSIVFRDGAAVPSPRFLYHDDRPEDLEPLRLAERKSGLPIRWGTDLP